MIRINLIADRKAKDKFLVQQQIVALAGLLLFSLFICFVMFESVVSSISSTQEEIKKEQQVSDKLKKTITLVREFEKKKEERTRMIKDIKELKKKQIGPMPFLDEINTVLPPEVWLATLSVSGASINLKGYAFSLPSVAAFIRQLESSKYFEQVRLVETKQVDIKSNRVQDFTLNFVLTAEKPAEEIKDGTAPPGAAATKKG